MGLAPVTIEQFPGVDLRQDPGDSKFAIDLQNVILEPGRVRVRDGHASQFSIAAAETANRIDYFPFGTIGQLIIQGTSNRVHSLNTYALVGAAVATAGSSGQDCGVAIGTPAASFYYTCNSTHVIRRWDGAVWTAPGTMPANPAVLGVMQTDNRLVVGDTGSKVWFSDPGAPETFGANNFVQLEPGDGEFISAICSYNNTVFIFKQTKFFVFYGNSTDASGNPIFNYRAVRSRVGIGGPRTVQFGPSPDSVSVGRDGVYFFGGDALYRTTGGVPERLSTPLDPYFGSDPFFAGLTYPFWTGSVALVSAYGPWRVTAVGPYVYMLGTNFAGNQVMWVYDTRTALWTYWTAPSVVGAAAVPMTNPSTPVLWMCTGAVRSICTNVGGQGTIPSDTINGTTPIVSRYRLPFESYGSPRQKRLRETIVEGSGTITAQWSKDWGALTTGSSLVLGTTPALADARQRLAMRGKTFSLQIGAATGYWSVTKVQANLSDALRGPEVAV